MEHPVRGLELYAHILGAEHVWLSRIEGRAPTIAVWPSLTLDQCEQIARDNRVAFSKLIKKLTPAMGAKEIAYTNSAGLSFTSTLKDILLHVALHGAYHRGQIAVALRATGDTPAATDFIAFARGTPAATRSQS